MHTALTCAPCAADVNTVRGTVLAGATTAAYAATACRYAKMATAANSVLISALSAVSSVRAAPSFAPTAVPVRNVPIYARTAACVTAVLTAAPPAATTASTVPISAPTAGSVNGALMPCVRTAESAAAVLTSVPDAEPAISVQSFAPTAACAPCAGITAPCVNPALKRSGAALTATNVQIAVQRQVPQQAAPTASARKAMHGRIITARTAVNACRTMPRLHLMNPATGQNASVGARSMKSPTAMALPK